MNKKEFFKELNEYLLGVPKKDKEELLQDYEEHFKIGKKKNRSEASIIKSLGSPKQIAREIRTELYSSEKTELKSEAVETWVKAKQFSKHLFDEAKDKIKETMPKRKNNDIWAKRVLIVLLILAAAMILNSGFFNLLIFVIIGYFIYKYFKGRSDSPKTKTKTTGKSPIRIIVSIAFNLLFFICFWISTFFTILALLVSSVAVIISAAAIIGFTIFALISHSSPLTRDILFAGLFAGLGILILGDLFASLFKWMIKLFFKLTKMYIELNNRFIRK
jgi:uncharacterized membrane protein